MTSGSLVSTSNVCSWPTDFAGSPSWTGSASSPRRAIDERRAVLAEPADERGRAGAPRGRRSSGRRTRQRRPPSSRRRPTAARSAAARGTPPPRPAARRPARRACAGRRRSWPRASCVATPTDAVSPTSSRTASLIRRGDRRARRRTASRDPVTSRNASSIEIGSTCGVKRRRIAMTSRDACW